MLFKPGPGDVRAGSGLAVLTARRRMATIVRAKLTVEECILNWYSVADLEWVDICFLQLTLVIYWVLERINLPVGLGLGTCKSRIKEMDTFERCFDVTFRVR